MASDVTVWGIAALVCGGLAVLSANVSAIIPTSVLAGLHASRLEGGSLNQLRSQIANLQTEAAELKRVSIEIQSRFTLAERGDGDVARRVGALEVSIPDLLERIPPEGIDTSAVTASIGDDGSMTYDTDGGSVNVKQRPLLAPSDAAVTGTQPMPDLAAAVEAPQPDADAFGLALGPSVTEATAGGVWDDLNGKVGTLLIGLAPLIEGNRIVAGPLRTKSDAQALCTRMALVGVQCRPVPFLGTPFSD